MKYYDERLDMIYQNIVNIFCILTYFQVLIKKQLKNKHTTIMCGYNLIFPYA